MGGYSCITGEIALFEGVKVGIWNKVSAHTEWILKAINDEEEDKDDDDDDDDDDDGTTKRPTRTTTTESIVEPAGEYPDGADYNAFSNPGPAQVQNDQAAHSEGAGDYSAFSNPGPQYGQPYQGAGFLG